MNYLFVGMAGFIGAILRYSIYLLESKLSLTNFPFATCIINLMGCLLAGGLAALTLKVSPDQKIYINLFLIGFVGSFTTFSTFSADNMQLIESNSMIQLLLNISLNLIGGVVMVWIGRNAFNAF